MIHIRLDDNTGGTSKNSEAKFACGLKWPLPEGDKYFFEAEVGSHYRVDCPGCNPGGARQLGTPISQLSGRPGEPGYEEFKRIAASWGYD
jgi:hypothetical protein